MSWLGAGIGAGIGAVIGGPIGAGIGGWLGHSMSKAYAQHAGHVDPMDGSRLSDMSKQEAQSIFGASRSCVGSTSRTCLIGCRIQVQSTQVKVDRIAKPFSVAKAITARFHLLNSTVHAL